MCIFRQKLKALQMPSVGNIVFSQMKENFGNMTKNDQYRVLTLMPPDCSMDFLRKSFNTTKYQAKRAKVIQAEKGILLSPNLKPGRRLSEETVLKVKQFYMSDDVSRQMPGKKDFVSINMDGEKQ